MRALPPRRLGAARLPPWLFDALVLASVAAVLLLRLGHGPIRDNNEALYADIGWAIARGSSWIIPHLDGVAYIEKPPLLYWLIAVSIKLFGVGAWQARLPDALASWLICASLLVWGRWVGAPLAGRFAALVCGSALGFVLIGRTILFDPVLLLGWLLAFGLLLTAVQRRQRRWLRIAAVAIGLATLTKGPVALLTLGLVAVVQLLVAPGDWRRPALLRFLLDPWALALFVATTLPWALLAAHQQAGFAWFFFVNETWGRFAGTRVPDDFHHGPWWFYGPKLLIGFFQWTPPLLALALLAPPAHGSDAAARSARWARNAALTLTVFYSAAADKGNYYLLPVIPLIAWWLGLRLERGLRSGRGAALGRALAAAVLVVGAALAALWAASLLPVVHAHLLTLGTPAAMFARLPRILLELELVLITAAVLLWRGRLEGGLLVFALSALVLVHLQTWLSNAKTRDTSQKYVAGVVHRLAPAGVRLYSWQDFEDQSASLLLYGFNPLPVIDSHSADLAFGCAHGGAACISPAQFLQARRGGQPVAVWVARDKLAGFIASGLGQGLVRIDFGDSAVFVTPGPEAAAIRP